MSTNNVNTNTQPPQKSDKEILDAKRKEMDRIKDDDWYADGNKKRKKLKRWFDRCRKKKLEDDNTKEGECCYKIDRQTKAIYMGKKASTNANHEFQLPYLTIDALGCNLHYQKESGGQQQESVLHMSYDDFYKLYRQAVGLSKPQEWFLNAWDGFMSWTQVPRQLKTKKGTKAKSVGGHVANIASRVFSPVIAPVLGAYEGASALKDKLIPTEEELSNRAANDFNSYQFPLKETQDDENLELKKAKDNHNLHATSFNDWVNKVFKNHEFGRQTLDIVKQQNTWYKNNIIEHDLEEINKAQPQQTTQGQ